jgi:chorismate mutase-like protein
LNGNEFWKDENSMTIEHWRTEIDEIDRELLRLLNRRARLAMKVGALKQNAGLPCCDTERERDVLTRLQQANGGPLDSRAIGKLFRRIIRESRNLETRMLTDREQPRGMDERRRSALVAAGSANSSEIVW